MGITQVRISAIACASISFFVARAAHAGQRSQSPPMSAGFGSSAAMSTSSSSTSLGAAVDVPVASPPIMVDAAGDPPDGSGSSRSYARRGTVEIGGFVNFSGANHFTSIQVSPTAGYFVFDGFELTAILGLNYVHETFDAGLATERSDHKTILRFLVEPSYHVPLASNAWGFVGVGLGVATTPRAGDVRPALDIAPRAGAKFLVGKSGLFTPAAFLDYTMNGAGDASGGSLLGVKTTYGLEAGYTVIW